jgi:hypothetical protein
VDFGYAITAMVLSRLQATEGDARKPPRRGKRVRSRRAPRLRGLEAAVGTPR